jgi:hypothetical protein
MNSVWAKSVGFPQISLKRAKVLTLPWRGRRLHQHRLRFPSTLNAVVRQQEEEA